MSFVYPNFLWAYFLIAIPIIIHLFNFRRYKTVYFSRVSFLKEVTEDSKSGNKLKHLLVLLSRILLILCLVTAFAQPFIPTTNSNQTVNVTSIYIDNSYSMQAEGKDGNLLNEVKNKSIELVKSLEANEKINLITSDLLSKHQRFYSKSEVIEMIKEIDFSSQSTPLFTVLNLQSDLLNASEEEANKRIFVFSDFQKSTNDLSNWKREEISSFYYQSVSEQKGNIYIDSVWFESPVHRVNTPMELHFRVQNATDKDLNDLPVGLSINGNNPGPKRISVPANSFTDETITFTDRTPGLKSGELKLTTTQLFFDDAFYFTYEIKEQVNILHITSNQYEVKNIEQLYLLDDYYNCLTTSITNVSSEDFVGKELVIFQNINKIPEGVSDLAEKVTQEGGTVVIIPGDRIEIANYNKFLSKNQLPTLGVMDSMNYNLDYFNFNDPLYNGVFEGDPSNYKFPRLNAAYRMMISSENNYISIFGSNANNTPFLLYASNFNGRMFLISSPLDKRYTNFQNHALFAATFLRIAETATYNKPLYMTIGELTNFPLNTDIDEKNPIHLINKKYGTDAIPQVINGATNRQISFNHLEDIIKHSGTYDLTNNSDFNEIVAFNYNRTESNVEAFETEEVKNNFVNAGWETAKQLDINDSGKIEINTFKPKEYWRILLILGLVFILSEVLLLKFWKS
ncbi:MAG: BatA and WFA domain-containing protein [Crocinitomicaceae bacterium]